MAILLGGSGLLLAGPTARAAAIPAFVGIATALSATSVRAGASVYDTATLSGFTSVPGVSGGNVVYYLWRGSGLCPSTVTPVVVSSVTVSPTGAVPHSANRTFGAVGSDGWEANYSGNANNPSALSPCETLSVNLSNPSIRTNLSATLVNTGVPVHDTATLSAATLTASGTVRYQYYANAACSGPATTVSVVVVTASVVPASASHAFAGAGSYGWQANYSGDANNSGAASACEPLDVTSVANVTLTTSLSASSIPVGGSVEDSATLVGATPSAAGNLTYRLYGSSSCVGSASPVATVAVFGGVASNSPLQAFFAAGSYGWQAVYSGDANNSPASSGCEPLVVVPAVTTVSTNLSVGTNDTFGPPIPATSSNGQLCEMAFDAANGYLYATLKQANDVMVVDGGTNTVVSTVAVGSEPCGIAYDASTHEVYVANSYGGGPGTVSVISGTGVVATVPVGDGPGSVAYDPRNGELYVANTASASLSLICDGAPACGGPGQAHRVIASVHLSANPDGAVVFDSSNGEVFTAATGTTFVVSGSTVTATRSTPGLMALGDGVFDPGNGYVYFPTLIGDLLVVNGATGALVATVGLSGFPLSFFDAAYDSANGFVYVPDQSGGLNVVSGTIVVNYLASAPEGTAVGYDPNTNVVYLGVTVSNHNELLPLTPVLSGRDSAILSGVTPSAGGTVTYRYFSGSSCGGSPTIVSSAAVTSGIVAPSAEQNLPTAAYSWEAVYSGDPNDTGSTSPCEPMQPTPVLRTSPYVDTVSLSFAMESYANVLVTPPNGGQAGFRGNGSPSVGGGGALELGPGTEPQLVSFPIPATGRYRIDLVGNANSSQAGSPFDLRVFLDVPNGTGSASVGFHGAIQPGEEEIAYLVLSANGSLELIPPASPAQAPSGAPFYLQASFLLPAAALAGALVILAVVLLWRRPARPSPQRPESPTGAEPGPAAP